ncbi:MAG: EAL domain-containing protein [Acidimicrobiales bacterium]
MDAVVPTIASERVRAFDRQGNRRALGTVAAVGFSALIVLLATYVVVAFVPNLGGGWKTVSEWPLDGFEIVASGLCLARAIADRKDRLVAIILGSGLLAWSLGDVVWTLETQGGGIPPTPSWADLCYLAFYPLAFVGLVALTRGEIKDQPLSRWLDGVVAGLGAAAVTVAFGFDTILGKLGGPPAKLATSLAYPIADLGLLALVIGGLAIVSYRNRRWMFLVPACVLKVAGDVFHLLQSSAATYRTGTLLDATWPAAILLISLAVWQPAAPSKERSRGSLSQVVVPAAAVVSSLVVLLGASIGHIDRVALVLATATVLVAGLRSVLGLRELSILTESHRLQALTDDLTGLGNRRHLMGVLDDFFSRGPTVTDNGRLALLLIDLDHFKEVNDSFGHPVGDQILLMLGPRLRVALRESDILVRLGGDEFGIVLADADARDAGAVAERLTAQFEQPFILDVASLHVTLSVGIALAPTHARESAELLRCADVAMYRAKAARCSYRMYETLPDSGQNRLRLIEQLRDAIIAKAFQLYFQPQYELRTGKSLGVEALLRWPHPEYGVLSPTEFIPLAEEAGLMRPLTDLVLEAALTQCAAWRADGRHLYVSVNLSATNLLDDGLPDRIRFLLARHRLGPGSLVVEVTETNMMADREKAQEVIQQLDRLGLVVSVDDFGTGFSSLAYLSDLAVRELKIDQALTKRLASSAEQKTRAVIRATIDLGHSLGMRVVAEGVEDAETYALLASLGCDLAQGNYMCRPLPAEKLSFGPARADARFNLLAPILPLGRSHARAH